MLRSIKVIGKIKQFRVVAEFLEDVNSLQRLRVYATK
jgi:hypothetical protein